MEGLAKWPSFKQQQSIDLIGTSLPWLKGLKIPITKLCDGM